MTTDMTTIPLSTLGFDPTRNARHWNNGPQAAASRRGKRDRAPDREGDQSSDSAPSRAGGADGEAVDSAGGLDAGIEELAASIVADGIICPLIVYAGASGLYHPADGGRRLAALRLLEARGLAGGGYAVPVIIRERPHAEGEEIAISYAANALHRPLHPVDEYEAFARLADAGLTEAAIAARYGVTARLVRQRLGLGRLSPTLREALRAEEIDADDAKAFTLATHHETQDEIFERLRAAEKLYAGEIRKEIIGDMHDARRFLAAIGEKAYTGAGGRIIRDLFDERVYVSHFPMLAKMADARLDAEALRLEDEGWRWTRKDTSDWQGFGRSFAKRIDFDEALHPPSPEDAAALAAARDHRAATDARITAWENFNAGELASEPDGPEIFEDSDELADADDDEFFLKELVRFRIMSGPDFAADRMRSGCFLSYDDKGRLLIEAGWVLDEEEGERKSPHPEEPGDASPGVAKDEGAEGLHEKKQKKLPAALFRTLTETMAIAAGRVVARAPDFALALVVAALEAREPSPVKLFSSPLPRAGSFATRLKDRAASAWSANAADLASKVASALDFTEADAKRWPSKEVKAIVDLLPGAMFETELAERFDALAFFIAAPKAFALAAIAECLGEDEAKSWVKKPAKETAGYAAAKATEHGWLPKELRTSHYDGPSSSRSSRQRAAANEPPSPASGRGAGGEGDAPQTEEAAE